MDHEAALGTVQSMLANEMEAKAANESRLMDYQKDYDNDPHEDTRAQVKRTERKIEANTKRIEVLEYVADVLNTDNQYERVYTTAASLFDTGEALDLKNEYHRGVTELVTRLLGIDSDDQDDVAMTISTHTGAHRLTEKDFGTGINGDLLYIGPLQPAIDFIKGPNRTEVEITTDGKGRWSVKFDGGNVWGTADTQEMAWRYALAAELGPIDEGFVPFMLTR